MSNHLRDLLDRGAATPASDVDVDALVRSARGRHHRRVGIIAGAVTAVVAVVIGAVVLAQPSSEVSIRSRPAAAVPAGWNVVVRGDVSLAIPPEWTQLDPWADEAITVGSAAFSRTGTIIPCPFAGAHVPAVAGTWVTVFEYRDLQRNDEFPLALVPALRTTDGWVIDRPADLRSAVTSSGSCGAGTRQVGPDPSTPPPAIGRYEVVAFREAGRVFVALLATKDAADDSAFDLAYQVLNTLQVGEPGTTPTSATAVTTPTTGPTATTVPATTVPATVPAIAGSDAAAIRDLFLAWINAQPKDDLEGIVEDFASIAETHRQGVAQHTEADLALYSGRVDSVTMIDDTHADVRYTILHGGQPQFSMMPGQAIRIDGKWMVTRETVCELLTHGGLTCPPRA
jgi:hypothetical protein